jgi:RNA-directed DNA polymerase
LEHLRILFDEMFNGELSFDDFLHGDITHRVNRQTDGTRVVFVADPTLRAYHRFLQRHFVRPLLLNTDVVYSYRKGVNISDAVRQHAHNKYFFQTDLSNFFGSITSELLHSTLVRSSEELKFLNATEYFDRAISLLTVDNRLPPGFSTSPSISNASLFQLDDSFQAYCNEKNLIFTRYSDDVIVSGNSDDDVNLASTELTNLVKKYYEDAFSFNLRKSKFTRVGRKIKLLGMVILPNGAVTIDGALKRKIEVLLHYYITDSFAFLRLVHDDLEKGVKSLSGYVSFVHAVDSAYFSKLCSKYSSSVIEGLLRMPK